MVDMFPVIDALTGKLQGFKESVDSVLTEPVELYDIPESIDWRKVRVQTAMNAITGLCINTKCMDSAIDVGQIVSDAIGIADYLVTKLQNNNYETDRTKSRTSE